MAVLLPPYGRSDPASSDWSYPAAELSSSPLALIVVLSAAETALIQAAVFGVFDMPFMADIQLAQQGLHGLLPSAYLAISMMALA
ncbi:hypothetical protein [Arthrobacter sp. SLBN-122]|uniref:hypothetical protein n=1 Tax=Arthrobacter sp. SLBN-122 TaxID=2768455 RepID=UPI00117010CC|nr:hypothetical protein [Arthrobacter sp. SLBN-122]TQJ36691.1 hypothetical protein FBY36_3995 [Arthrobacter sp. SLBN-122]